MKPVSCHHFFKVSLFLLLQIGIVSYAGDALCSPITYYFGGQITRVNDMPDVDGVVPTTILLGDAFTGTITYDADLAAQLPSDGTPHPMIIPYTLNVGNGKVVFTNCDSSYKEIYISSRNPLFLHAIMGGGPGVAFENLMLNLSDSSGTFDGSRYPTAQDMLLFDSGDVFFLVTGPSFTSINGVINHFSANAPAPVPEPSSIILLGGGLLSIAGFGMRMKKQ